MTSKSAHDHKGHDHGPNDDHKHGEGEGGHGHAHGGLFGERTELIFALLCGATLLVGWLISLKADGWIPLAFYMAAYVFGGWFTLTEAIENLRKRKFEIDTLMLVAAAGRDLEPHLIAAYALELAQAFQSYYNEHQILVDDDAQRSARLALAQATRQALANALELLGVNAPEVM